MLFNVLLNILLCYCVTCLCLMSLGTVGLLVKPHIIESIKTQCKYEMNYEVKSTFQVFLFYYGFCWLWPYLLLDELLNKDDD